MIINADVYRRGRDFVFVFLFILYAYIKNVI